VRDKSARFGSCTAFRASPGSVSAVIGSFDGVMAPLWCMSAGERSNPGTHAPQGSSRPRIAELSGTHAPRGRSSPRFADPYAREASDAATIQGARYPEAAMGGLGI
jgi:hypothetical protein